MTSSSLYVLKTGWFHKKGLGFPSPEAASLVQKEDVASCKKRFVALINEDRVDAPWHIRYFKEEVALDSDALNLSLESLVSNPSIPLKGVIILSGQVQVKVANGVLCISTNERTLLLAAGDDSNADTVEDWHSLLSSYLIGLRQAEEAEKFEAATQRQQQQQPAAQPQQGALSEKSIVPTATSVTSEMNIPARVPSRRRSSVHRASQALRQSMQSAQTRGGSDGIGTLEAVLADPLLRTKFRSFVNSAFAIENLDFYEAIERHLLIPENDIEAAKVSARKIVDHYVREDAPEQINLSSNQSSSLIASLSGPEYGETLLCLLQCQHEILELLRRNFFFSFKATIEQERQRVQMLQNTQGCFPALLEKAGVDVYLSIMEMFGKMQEDNKLLANYVKRRQETIAGFVQANLRPSASGFKFSQIQARSLQLSANALRSSMDAFEIQAKTMSDYIEEVTQYVIEPLKTMSGNIDTSLSVIKKKLQPLCDGIVDARRRANEAGKNEIISKQMIVTLSTRLAELEASGKRKEKDLKKNLALFEKIKKESLGYEQARSDAELELVMKETNANEEFASELLKLESLALYRLDTIKDLLSKLAFAEQTALSRMGLKFQTILNDCTAIDSVKDLVSLARDAEKLALERRQKAIADAATANAHAQTQTSVVEAVRDFEDDVPVAEAINNNRMSRRRFF